MTGALLGCYSGLGLRVQSFLDITTNVVCVPRSVLV